MFSFLSPLFQTIRRFLAYRAETQRLKVIREALQTYATRRGVNINIKTNEYEQSTRYQGSSFKDEDGFKAN